MPFLGLSAVQSHAVNCTDLQAPTRKDCFTEGLPRSAGASGLRCLPSVCTLVSRKPGKSKGLWVDYPSLAHMASPLSTMESQVKARAPCGWETASTRFLRGPDSPHPLAPAQEVPPVVAALPQRAPSPSSIHTLLSFPSSARTAAWAALPLWSFNRARSQSLLRLLEKPVQAPP